MTAYINPNSIYSCLFIS